MTGACIAHKSLEIFERCRLWQRNFQLSWQIPLLFALCGHRFRILKPFKDVRRWIAQARVPYGLFPG